MKTYNHMTVKPINGAMGAEVFDIDLSKSLSDPRQGQRDQDAGPAERNGSARLAMGADNPI